MKFWVCLIFLQVMWSTFVPFIPNSILPGIIALVAALLAVALVDFFLPIFSFLVHMLIHSMKYVCTKS